MVSGSGEVPGGIAQIVRPIRGEQDLDQLLDLIGTARIVLIGEASHGTHEFYDLRASLTRKLITYHGFDAVAIEGDWPDALRVDRYVRRQGDDDFAQDALAAFERFPQWLWRNTAVATFVDWLRSWNAQRPPENRAGFYGLDLYSLFASIRAVLSFLDEADPAAGRVARERYACFDHAGGDAEHYGAQAQFGLAASCEDEVVAQLVEMQRRHAARSGRMPSGDGWFHAMQNAHVIKDAEAYYRAMFGGRSASWNLRDTHMADTLDLLAQHLGIFGRPAKLVVWAHNSHVGDARATQMGAGGELTLGQLMRQRHPGETLLIGMTTHTGAVRCAHEWDGPSGPARVRPSLPGSWEELFHQVGIPRFYVTAAALRQLGEGVERLHRAIGVIYRPETERRSHYYDARLAEQYDVVIHVDTTHAVKLFDVTTPVEPVPDDQEPPETFPTGL
ncbi:MAG TPA: erythromycin esterase family protein [Kofleriaceae bacterium]|nr:erythromycin esterase family protein [Kofleriaceae bacterium]